MNRRRTGAAIGKIWASISASVVLCSTVLPVAAQVQSDELAPQVSSPVGDMEQPALISSGKTPGLTYTPDAEPASEQSSNSSPALNTPPAENAAAGKASPAVAESQAPAATPVPELRPSPDQGDSQSDSRAQADSQTQGEAQSTSTAQSTTGAQSSSDEQTSDSTQQLASKDDSGDGTASGTDADGKQIGQAASLSQKSPLDPAYRKLPATTGTVHMRKAFDMIPLLTVVHNLSFRDTPVKEVVAEIARRGNLNIVIDKSVVGRITGELHDVTLNEAMDSVLASTGLQWRQLDNSTVIIGSSNALFSLGLNRPMAKIFKLSYANAFDVAGILFTSVFNRGVLQDFNISVRNRAVNSSRESPTNKTAEESVTAAATAAPGGGTQQSKTQSSTSAELLTQEENEIGAENNSTSRPDQARALRGAIRTQLQEGTGFAQSSTDPGSMAVRSFQAVVSDFSVDQNGGGAIVIPDSRNNQVIVCGTRDDINVAEECIRLIDRRPRQIHIQSSLIELNNQGIRQLGAALNLQGGGASGSVLGGSGAPLVQFLPGLGSPGQLLTQNLVDAGGVVRNVVNRLSGLPPTPLSFSQVNPGPPVTSYSQAVTPGLTDAGAAPPTAAFPGFIGTPLPVTTPAAAGVTASSVAQTGFNFLTLGKKAGGVSNIATMASGLNFSVNLALQTNKGKLLANPSVIVNDNTEALIVLANEVIHKVTTTVSLGVVSTNVELVKAGIFLDVLPRVTEDGFIVMRIRPTVSSPLGAPQQFAGGNVIVTLLNVRDVLAQEVRVKDGQTLVIGGLFTELEASTLAKVPYLAEAPILGALFRNSIKGRNRTELLLMITPKIVEDQPTTSLSDSPANPITM